MDLKSYMRFKGSIEAALEAVRPDDAGASGKAMPGSYTRLRERADKVLADEPELLEELNEICPQTDWPLAGRSDPFETAAAYNEARAYLSRMLGWFSGLIEGETWELQMKANAEAYAAEKVRQERKVGFGNKA